MAFHSMLKKYLRSNIARFEEYLKSNQVHLKDSSSLNTVFEQYLESKPKMQSEKLFTRVFKEYLKSQPELSSEESSLLENISAYIKIEEIKPYSQYNYLAKGHANPLVDPFIIKNKDLECSGFKEIKVGEEQNEEEGKETKEKNDSTYIENVCNYETVLQLNPNQLEPTYLFYDYCLGNKKCGDITEKAFLTNTLSDDNQHDVPMTLVKEDFSPMYPIFMKLKPLSSNSPGTAPPKKGDSQQAGNGPGHELVPSSYDYYPIVAAPNDFIGNRIHIFLNLSPELSYKEKPNSDGETNREHTIIYKMNNASKLKSQWESLPPEVSVHLSCKKREALLQDSHSSCPCEEPVISHKGVEIKCSFNKAKVDLFTHWETSNPYVYFLNADPKHNARSMPHKKTPVIKHEIN